MILSDISIKQRIRSGSLAFLPPVETEKQVQPASLDVRLGGEFIRFARLYHQDQAIGVDSDTLKAVSVSVSIPKGQEIIIDPGEFLLGTTLEKVFMPDDLVARVEGRSSIGRLGITVHVTAGFIDPGFNGHITLEIANLNRYPVVLAVGMRVAQLAFHSMTTPAAVSYGHGSRNNKYQGQTSVTHSKIDQEIKR